MIFLLIFLIFIFILIVCVSEDNLVHILSFMIGAFILAIIASLVEENTPTALDVYRNKTYIELKGHYEDSVFVVTDSVVHLKPEYV